VIALGPVRRYLAVARQFLRIGLIRKSQLRLEFFTQVAMDCLWYLSHVLVFEILFLHTGDIAGWSLPEVRVFLGFVFAADAFMMTWLGQAWHFGRELKDGLLDPVRVRPIAPVFLYFFQRFSLEGALNGLVALAYLGSAVALSPVGLTPSSALLAVWGLAIACWGRTVLSVLMATLEFYAPHASFMGLAHEVNTAAGENPLDIFGRRTRAFLLYAVPLGALAHLPASLVLGRVGLLAGALHTSWLALLGMGAIAWWSRGFRRYESALG
jgi:ABC-2 type transport system permease protein